MHAPLSSLTPSQPSAKAQGMIIETFRPVDISSGLAEISAPPERLYCFGDASVLRRQCVTVVGTRRPTPEGLRAAFRFGRTFADAGLVVVSGLARGVDTKAHEGALRGGGVTVAVLAHGLDRIYPPENRPLAKEIVDRGGCLLSEYPPGTPPRRGNFPARNRILSGLSWGTVVIEAGPKSGSLITAGFALDQGRELFVVPGSFDAPSFSGSHRLISDGAALVADPAEVLGSVPRCNDAPEKDLARWFQSKGGETTLSELFCVSRLPLWELERRLEEALEAGQVLRLSAQRYLYVG